LQAIGVSKWKEIMARCKQIDAGPRFLAVNLEAQLLPGTLEHALNHLLDHEIDLRAFEAVLKNEDVGATDLRPSLSLCAGEFQNLTASVRIRRKRPLFHECSADVKPREGELRCSCRLAKAAVNTWLLLNR
jgi:hypothetical protein